MTTHSIWQLVIIFLILLLLFGSKKIRTLGKDLGDSIRGFKDSMDGKADETATPKTIEAKVEETDKNTTKQTHSETDKG